MTDNTAQRMDSRDRLISDKTEWSRVTGPRAAGRFTPPKQRGRHTRHHTPAGAVALLFPCLVAAARAGTFDAWKYKGDVKAPEGGFVALELPPEALDACDKDDLSDLRLADPAGTEVPHAIVLEKEIREEKELEGQALNRENPTPETSRITVDFGKSVVKNRITVVTSGTNFRRHVRVEGSADQESWAEVLKAGWLFAVGQGQRFESLDLGRNTYRYIRVTVTKMPEERTAPRIQSVSCRDVIVRKPRDIAVSSSLQYTQDPRARTSTALVDFNHRHLPLVRLKLALATDPERVFRRTCNVWGRNTLTHTERIRFETDELGEERVVETPWSYVGSGNVFRDASGSSSLDLDLGVPFRYVKIIIENGDSPPLDLGGVKGVMYPIHAVFQPAGQTRFSLYCGNPEAPAPRYEARDTLAALDPRKLARCQEVRLGEQPSAMKKELPPSQAAVWIIMVIALLATVALLGYTAMAASRRKDRPECTPAEGDRPGSSPGQQDRSEGPPS